MSFTNFLDLLFDENDRSKARQKALDQWLYRESAIKKNFAIGAVLIKMGANPFYDYNAEEGLVERGSAVSATALTTALQNLPSERGVSVGTLLDDLGLFFDAAFAVPNLDARFFLAGGITPLMLAIKRDTPNTRHLHLIERLIPISNVDAADSTDHTALMHALINRHKDACALLAPISNMELRNCSGKTTLELSLELAGANRPHFEKEKQEILNILIAETERRELMENISMADGGGNIKRGTRI